MGPTASPPSSLPPPAAPNYFHPADLIYSRDFHSFNTVPAPPLRSDASHSSVFDSGAAVDPPSPKLEDFLGGASMPPVNSIDSAFLTLVHDQYYSHLHRGGDDVIFRQQIHDHNNYIVANDISNGNSQCLSLSMNPASCVETKKRGSQKLARPTVHRKSIDTFGQRTSQYRGVTRHRWTGRYEAHLWDNSCKKEGQTRKGRQVYLGGYDLEDKAARAYDLAALKYWGHSTHINFALESYIQELDAMKSMSRQEYVAHLRRKSSGFSRGASMYRGVTRHHQHGRWQARIGRVAGNKDLYLGTFSTQEEAAEAYDIAAVKFRGANAVTNFDISRYDVEKIMGSSGLPTGDVARRRRTNDDVVEGNNNNNNNVVSLVCESDWKMIKNNQSNGRDREDGCLQDLIGFEMSPTIVSGSGEASPDGSWVFTDV